MSAVFSGRDIVYLSNIDWDFLWQGNQEIAKRLGAAGNRVLFVENTGIRTPTLRDAGRVLDRLRRGARPSREPARNVRVHAPLVLPPFGGRWRTLLNETLLIPRMADQVRALGMRQVVLWTYLPTDTALALRRALGDLVAGIVYYCVADFPALSDAPARVRAAEQELLGASDVVFASCAMLAERFRPFASRVIVTPFGVDTSVFTPRPARASPPWPRPIIGYVGGLHRHVDLELLAAVAESRPRWSFVLVGSTHADVSALARLRNVHRIGARPHGALPDLIAEFDVAIVPYRRSPHTETVVPTKINEYLAMGKPVVSTDLPAVVDLARTTRVVEAVPPRRDEFLAAIERALDATADPAAIEHRRGVAARADWRVRFAEMSREIDSALAARQAARA